MIEQSVLDDLVAGAAAAMSCLVDFGQGNGRGTSLIDEAYAHLHWMHDVLAEEAHRAAFDLLAQSVAR